MKAVEELFFQHKKAWRKWLNENFMQPDPVWLIFYKKHTAKATLSYDDAVEQALCYGWIDGTVRSIDEEKYQRKFYPRKNILNWSPTNQNRVNHLISTGEMTEYGMVKIGYPVIEGRVQWPPETAEKQTAMPAILPAAYLKQLKLQKTAYHFFMELSPSQQKRYVGWIMQARQESTRQKRLEESIELLKNKVKNLIK